VSAVAKGVVIPMNKDLNRIRSLHRKLCRLAHRGFADPSSFEEIRRLCAGTAVVDAHCQRVLWAIEACATYASYGGKEGSRASRNGTSWPRLILRLLSTFRAQILRLDGSARRHRNTRRSRMRRPAASARALGNSA